MSETQIDVGTEPVTMADYRPGGEIATVGGAGGTLMSLAPEAVTKALAQRAATTAAVMDVVIREIIPPRAWVDMGGKAYLQGDGALAAFRFLGLLFKNQPGNSFSRNAAGLRVVLHIN